jgi:sulfur-oxidizing protein SoxA
MMCMGMMCVGRMCIAVRCIRLMRGVLTGSLLLAALLSALLTGPARAQAPSPPDPRRSGFDFMSAPTQAMQRDDNANPGMLWVRGGEALWSLPTGAAGKACVSCHAAAASGMRGVAARYPAWDEALQRPLTLAQRINQCRVRHLQAPALGPTHDDLLSLEAFVAHASRGLPLAPPDDVRLAPARARGEALFQRRIGQINLSCAQCHDGQSGRRLAGSVIPQAHPTGYPIYRLEWQGLGSLQRRIRGCMSGVRAEPYAFDAQELVDLEAYLAVRARGLPIETPAVRP